MTLITGAAGLGCVRTAILSTSSAPAAGNIDLALGAAFPGEARDAASTIVAAAMSPVRACMQADRPRPCGTRHPSTASPHPAEWSILLDAEADRERRDPRDRADEDEAAEGENRPTVSPCA